MDPFLSSPDGTRKVARIVPACDRIVELWPPPVPATAATIAPAVGFFPPSLPGAAQALNSISCRRTASSSFVLRFRFEFTPVSSKISAPARRHRPAGYHSDTMSDVLVRIKRAVLAGRFEFSGKAADEMDADDLTRLDVAESILNAVAIYKTIRSISPYRNHRREMLHIIQSTTLTGVPV